MGWKRNAGSMRKKSRYGNSTQLSILLSSALVTCVLIFLAGIQPSIIWSWLKTRAFPRSTIVYAPLVGPKGVVAPNPIGTDSSVSSTPLKLVLTATQPGRNVHDGYARIGISAHSPQTYSAGASLANGARLQEIYKDCVVLERAGQTVRVFVTGREPADYKVTGSPLLFVGGVASPDVAHADSRDPLAEVIRMSPDFHGNAFAGLKVFPNSQSDIFFRLGLQEDDVITAVDGLPLSDQKSAIAALRPLLTGQALTVVVRRGDQHQTIALNGSGMF